MDIGSQRAREKNKEKESVLLYVILTYMNDYWPTMTFLYTRCSIMFFEGYIQREREGQEGKLIVQHHLMIKEMIRSPFRLAHLTGWSTMERLAECVIVIVRDPVTGRSKNEETRNEWFFCLDNQERSDRTMQSFIPLITVYLWRWALHSSLDTHTHTLQFVLITCWIRFVCPTRPDYDTFSACYISLFFIVQSSSMLTLNGASDDSFLYPHTHTERKWAHRSTVFFSDYDN